MDKGNGAGFGGSNNPQECWEVYKKVMEETKILDDYLEEECSPRSYDGIKNFFFTNLFN